MTDRAPLLLATAALFMLGCSADSVRTTEVLMLEDVAALDERDYPPGCGFPASMSLNVGQTLELDVYDYCMDPEDYPLTIDAEASNDNVTISISTDETVLSLTGKSVGFSKVDVTVTDIVLNNAYEEFIAVVYPNLPPVFTPPPRAIYLPVNGEGVIIDLDWYFEDPEDGYMRFSGFAGSRNVEIRQLRSDHTRFAIWVDPPYSVPVGTPLNTQWEAEDRYGNRASGGIPFRACWG